MNKAKLFPSLIAGFAIAVVSIIPILSGLNCCLFVPLASFFALVLFNKEKKNGEAPAEKISASDVLMIALLIAGFSSVFEAVLQSIMIYVSKENQISEAIKMMESLMSNIEIPEFILNIERDIDSKRFSPLLSVFILINAMISNFIFSAIGGFIGMSVINKKSENQNKFFDKF